MAETKLENNSSDQLSDAADGLTRRELLKRGGKIAAAAAVSSVFSPFFIHSARAVTKTLSFWQFYAPNGISNLQSKWFVDCVAAWNATHDVKVELVNSAHDLRLTTHDYNADGPRNSVG